MPQRYVPDRGVPERFSLDDASLTNVSLGQSVPDECVMTLNRTADNHKSYILAETQALLT
jgi:hypothetical protein